MLPPLIPLGDPLVRAVDKTMKAYDLVQPGDRVLVGFSGGPDSTALLLCLQCLAARQAISPGAAHLNHGLRGARAAEDARHAARVAAALHIPFVSETLSVAAFRRTCRMSPEEAGRVVRHRFLQQAAADGGYNRIALGHHRDDDAESLLMRFLRGSGPLGLSGIPPQGRGVEGDIPVIRPLLRVPRAEIQAFVQRNDIPVREDESNADRRFLRNRIRHELMPLLKSAYNPRLDEGLSRMAQLMREEETWLGELTTQTLEALLVAEHGTSLVLDRRGLEACPPALQRRVLRAAVVRCKGDLRHMGFVPLEAIRRFAVQGPREGALDLPDALALRGRADRLELVRRPGRGRAQQPGPAIPRFAYRVASPGRLAISEAGVVMVFALLARPPHEGVYGSGQQTAFFDMDQLRFPLTVRNFQPGDRLAPLGMQGSQKVKKVLGDRKIARQDRPRIPLLVSAGEIIWIAGVRQARTARISPRTKRWLKVDLIGCLWGQDD